jgi:cystathionine beta-lyase/cystathionine gamma-synthase
MTHSDVPVATRESTGITGGPHPFVVGLEDAIDIVADLDQALRSGSAEERSHSCATID